MKNTERSRQKPKKSNGWIIKIFFLTLALAVALSFTAETTLQGFSLPWAIFVLLCFIFVGILFDTIGISVATAPETPFASMSSKKVRGAARALTLIKRADMVSNICNDVVGDVCGIISGASGAAIAVGLSRYLPFSNIILIVSISALIAAITVGGKAIGKKVAMKNNRNIVLAVGNIIDMLMIWKSSR